MGGDAVDAASRVALVAKVTVAALTPLVVYVAWSATHPQARFWAWARCTWGRRGHDPRRLPYGGFACTRCGDRAAGLEEWGLLP